MASISIFASWNWNTESTLQAMDWLTDQPMNNRTNESSNHPTNQPTNQPTPCQQSPSWKVNGSSTILEIPCISWNPKVHNHFFLFCKMIKIAQLQLIYKLSRSYMFRHYRVIFRQLVFITSPTYTSTSIAAVGNTI